MLTYTLCVYVCVYIYIYTHILDHTCRGSSWAFRQLLSLNSIVSQSHITWWDFPLFLCSYLLESYSCILARDVDLTITIGCLATHRYSLGLHVWFFSAVEPEFRPQKHVFCRGHGSLCTVTYLPVHVLRCLLTYDAYALLLSVKVTVEVTIPSHVLFNKAHKSKNSVALFPGARPAMEGRRYKS